MPGRTDLIAIAPMAAATQHSQIGKTEHRITHLPVLVLHAHTSCNCRCIMCDIWKTNESRSLQPADLEPHLTSIRQLGTRWVVFSGGEALLNREWPKLCAILKFENIRLTLLTTGLLLQKQATQIAESFDDIIISLDGPERIHDEIRGVTGAFRLMEQGIVAIRKLRPTINITARSTVQKANHAHFRDTVAAAKSLNLNGISFLASDLTSEAFNRATPWTEDRQTQIALSSSETQVLETEIDKLLEENADDIATRYIAESPDKLRRIARHFRAHLGLDTTESPRCNAPWTSAVIETDGSVRPCFFHRPIGNIHSAPLGELLNGNDALHFRASLDIATNPTCNRCVCSLNYRG
jgi:MoaA/NifB/PqqE/SkfB family radical SAM enzyme